MEKKETSKIIVIRTVKRVDFSVFCVDGTGQKKYFDQVFRKYLPFSSGQQVKKSMINHMVNSLGVVKAPLNMSYEIGDGDELKQKEITQPCDPRYFDQLSAGWMSKPNKNNDDSDDVEGVRRSPASISAMTALHPLLAGIVKEENMSFNRIEDDNDNIIVRKRINSSKSEIMSVDDVREFLEKNNKKISKNKFIGGGDRVNGIFKQDTVIDLLKLFRVSTRINDSETTPEILQELKEEGWTTYVDEFGREFLELPKQYHEQYADAIANGIVDWMITSNQSRTNDIMPTISVSVSSKANNIDSVYYAEFVDSEMEKVKLVVENNVPDVNTYSTNGLKNFAYGVETSITALSDAAADIKKRILEYYK